MCANIGSEELTRIFEDITFTVEGPYIVEDGAIGEPQRRHTIEPIEEPSTEPVHEPAPAEPVREPEPVPA